jgi:micrococcal nuclease
MARKKAPQWGAFFVWALAFYALAASLPVAGADSETARVQRALDGDSLLLSDGRQVRLIGINTPEFGKDGAPAEPLAQAARDRLAGLVDGRSVRLKYETERFDRYRRTLAHVFLPDGSDVEALLLRDGLAWFVAIPPNVARLADYRAAEAEARVNRRGIWGHPLYTPIPAERLSPNHVGFRRVEGVIGGARRRHGSIELELGPLLTLVIPRGTVGFENALSWTGGRLVARGWIAGYNGRLRMRITHRAMLEMP